jgi:PAS domain S-box-containing protein
MTVLSQLSTPLRYGLAVVAVLLALLLTMTLPALAEQGVFVLSLFLIAVAIVALYGGWGPGLLTIGLSVLLLDYVLIPPRYMFAIDPLRNLIGLAIFMASALLLVTLSVAHKRSEAVFRESESQLKHAQALAHLGSYTLHIPYLKTDHWSEETFRIIGLDPMDGELSPENYIQRAVHPEDQAYVTEVVEQAVRDAKTFDFEYRIVRPDGGIRWVQSIGAPVTDQKGMVVKLLGTLHDITERRLAKEALEESEARYRAIVEGQTELICRFRPDAVITFVNEAYCRYFQKTPEEVVGQSVLWIFPESQRERARAHIASLQTRPRIAVREHEVMTSYGERRWLEWTDRAITDEHGCVTKIQSIGRDITERKQAETDLRRLSGRLLQLQDEERRRIARELHDSTAQSLAALSMNLTVVETDVGGLSGEAKKALGESLALARHSTRELRTLSYLLHPPLLDESGLISAMQWYVDGIAQRSGIRIDLDLPSSSCRFPEEVETALFRIMQECLTNVLKHSGSSTARIRLTADESRVVMEIRDQGKGMSTVALRKDGDKVSSLGVGLMGMRERVRQLQGWLDLKTGSWGTAVTVTLPLDGGDQWTHFAS